MTFDPKIRVELTQRLRQLIVHASPPKAGVA